MVTDVAISVDRNVIKKNAEKILKYKDLTQDIERMWNVIVTVIPVIMGGNWNHLKIIHKIPQKHTRKARNQGATKNSHIGHCAHS